MHKHRKEKMIELTVFCSENELLQLTGASDSKELWEAGFDLDDWDFGFATKDNLDEDNNGDWYLKNWIKDEMMRCSDYEHYYYKGKHYYIAYH